jgi:catalase
LDITKKGSADLKAKFMHRYAYTTEMSIRYSLSEGGNGCLLHAAGYGP